MTQNKKEKDNKNIMLTVNSLKGKKSVRATFRLPQHVIDLLTVVAGQLGIKQKSLFDQLIENVAILDQLAYETPDYPAKASDRRQKTFVISRRSLLSLNAIAKKEQIPRDLLVEISINRLLPIIETELKKHNKRKEILKEMREYLQQGQRVLEQTEKLIGKDDSVFEMIKKQVSLAQKNVSELDSIIEKGLPLEDW